MDLRQRRFLRWLVQCAHPLAYIGIFARFALLMYSLVREVHTHTESSGCGATHANGVYSICVVRARCTDGAHNKITKYTRCTDTNVPPVVKPLNVHFVIYFICAARAYYRFSHSAPQSACAPHSAHTHTAYRCRCCCRSLLVRKLFARRTHICIHLSVFCLLSANTKYQLAVRIYFWHQSSIGNSFQTGITISNARYISGKRTITQCRLGMACPCVCVCVRQRVWVQAGRRTQKAI